MVTQGPKETDPQGLERASTGWLLQVHVTINQNINKFEITASLYPLEVDISLKTTTTLNFLADPHWIVLLAAPVCTRTQEYFIISQQDKIDRFFSASGS